MIYLFIRLAGNLITMQVFIKYGFFAVVALMVAAAPDSAMAGYPVLATGDECTDGTLGGMMCNLINNSSGVPGVITGLAYIAGLIFGFLGVMKLKDHVENPSQTPIWDPIKRFTAGGGFFVLPFVANIVRETMEDGGTSAANTGFSGSTTGSGLDALMVKLMANITEPTIWLIGWFGWLAGLILVFIGISRLMQTEQQGPRGPTGIGTIMTFLIAGCLFSINSIIAYINTSVFDTTTLQTNAALQYTEGLDGAANHVHAVLSSIIAFAAIIGWISVVRGLFIIRGVSEGSSQASMMAAMTHLIGGVLAINIGGVIMAVQTTLGIADYGIIFK